MLSHTNASFAQIYNPYSKNIQFFEGIEEGQSPDMSWTSFDQKQNLHFVKSDKSLSDFQISLQENTLSATTKSSYFEYIDAIKKGISLGHFQKVVAARIIQAQENTTHWPSYFDRLVAAFPNTFVFLIYHPQAGFWIGASPELVGYLNHNVFKTISLAGTVWGATHFESKEQNEQEIVTDYMHHLFDNPQWNVQVNPLDSVAYGQIKHLVNEIQVTPFLSEKFERIVAQIHPSPALSGFPVPEATAFIHHQEPIQRSFYSGLLSWQLSEQEKLAFATIRCFQVFENQLSFYVGGGITKDSNSETEFEETQRKFQVIYDVISE